MVTSPIALSWEHYTNMENLFWNSSFGLAVNVLQPFEDGNDLVATRCVEPDLKDRRTIEPTLGIKGDSHRALPRRFLAQNAQNDYGLESNDYGLESAKPDLQSTFKKPGGDTAAA